MTAAADNFIAVARATYVAANAAALRWMLDRPPLHGAFLNTKMNSLTLADYGPTDGARGPDYTYGWIQGRGLEALATHAAFFADEDPALAADLDAHGRRLYGALKALQATDGHAYFCYDNEMAPVRFEGGVPLRQTRSDEVFTYADAFVAKGLVAGAARYAPEELGAHLDYLQAVIEAIPAGRFQQDESRPLAAGTAATQPNDYGPRMILLGAAALLARLGKPERAAFAVPFIEHVLARHFDAGSGLLVDVPGRDSANVGHALEFVGFVLEYLHAATPPTLVSQLEKILVMGFNAGFLGPGISLAIAPSSGAPLSPLCPWWSLPEAIRAAALCYEVTGSAAPLKIWRRAHEAFFTRYWRGTAPIAYQTMNQSGPVDYVPATPDLDPGYHTGLSLLAAIEVASDY